MEPVALLRRNSQRHSAAKGEKDRDIAEKSVFPSRNFVEILRKWMSRIRISRKWTVIQVVLCHLISKIEGSKTKRMFTCKHLLNVILLSPLMVAAQVGIGTTSPDASAKLQVDATTQGLLPPRVSLTATNATTPVTSPATGLLVYNIATAGTSPNNVTPGYYYYSGSAWVRLIGPSDNAANVTGTVAIANGGTGQTTSNAALNALLPSQTGNADKILKTDGTNTTWATNVALASAVTGTFPASPGGYSGTSTSTGATGATITLPAGKWSVQITVLITPSPAPDASQSSFLNMFLSNTSGGSISPDAVGTYPVVSGTVTGPSQYGVIVGTIVINNTSGSDKTYHLVKGNSYNYGDGWTCNFNKLGGRIWGENTMVAYPMN